MPTESRKAGLQDCLRELRPLAWMALFALLVLWFESSRR
mgnify:CR=1 FL=1